MVEPVALDVAGTRVPVDVDRLASVHGLSKDQLCVWLNDVAVTLTDVINELGVTNIRVTSGGVASIAIDCDSEQGRWILKSYPTKPVLDAEARALIHWGPGCAPRAEVRHGWLILEHLGEWVDHRDDPDHVTRCLSTLSAMAAAGVPEGAWSTVDASIHERFATARLRALDPGSPVDVAVVDLAAEVAVTCTERFADQWPTVLCHNDLHGRNVFDDTRTVKLIDPRPAVGSRAWDLAGWVACGGGGRFRDRYGAVAELVSTVGANMVDLDRVVGALCVERAVALSTMAVDTVTVTRLARIGEQLLTRNPAPT